MLLPGLGVRVKSRRWLFEASIEPGLSIFFTNGQIVLGSSTRDWSFGRSTFTLRGDLAACRRLDPMERACVFFAPALYEFGAINGGSVGLRWELGA